jgi:hypothetical protein
MTDVIGLEQAKADETPAPFVAEFYRPLRWKIGGVV